HVRKCVSPAIPTACPRSTRVPAASKWGMAAHRAKAMATAQMRRPGFWVVSFPAVLAEENVATLNFVPSAAVGVGRLERPAPGEAREGCGRTTWEENLDG